MIYPNSNLLICRNLKNIYHKYLRLIIHTIRGDVFITSLLLTEYNKYYEELNYNKKFTFKYLRNIIPKQTRI